MMELVRAVQNLRRQETANLTDEMIHQSELLQRDRLTLANYEYLARRFCCLRCPALPARARNRLFPAVNRQLKKSYEKKTKSLKLADLTPQKDAKGGAGKASAPSSSSTPTVPTSLDEFLKRDSLSIKR